MPLTKVSFSVIQVANNVTSTTVGNTTSIPSFTFDQNGVITAVSNTAISGAGITANTVANSAFQTGSVENYLRGANLDFGMRNRIINGAMVIDQRNAGASVTPTDGVYTLDRWRAFQSVVSKYTVQQNAASVTPPIGFTNYLGVTSLSAYSPTGSEYFFLSQAIEGLNVSDLGWGTANAKTVTLSFWVRSSLTGQFGAVIYNNGYSRSYPILYTISSANTWQQISITVAGDTSGTWLTTNGIGIGVNFSLGAGSTVSAASGAWTSTSSIFGVTGQTQVVGTSGATFYITGIQLEVGSSATGFEYRQYQQELALCQRYFERWAAADQNLVGFCYAANNLNVYAQFLVEKRAAPTLTRYGTFTAFVNGAGNTLTFAAYNAATKAININWTGGGISAGQAFAWSSSGSPNQLEFSAEL